MIIILDSEKAFDNIQYPSCKKSLVEAKILGTYLNTTKVIANIKLKGEKLEATPLK